MTEPKKHSFRFPKLQHSEKKTSPAGRLAFVLSVLALSFVLFFCNIWIVSGVYHKDLPKTYILKMANVRWQSRVEGMNRAMDAVDESLSELARRDDEIYRNLFGLSEISPGARNAGIQDARRYEDLAEKNASLAAASRRLDMLLKKADIQSHSYSESEVLARRAGEIAVCIPAICPISTIPGTFQLSSPFGMRDDPLYRGKASHEGVDLASFVGNPVYASGSGKVVAAGFNGGYGRCVVIEHGFGYITKYAHLSGIAVEVGQQLSRGMVVGYVGSSGKSTGSHLHYEVVYRGRPVNPMGFMDIEMPYDDWRMVITEVPPMKPERKSSSRKK